MTVTAETRPAATGEPLTIAYEPRPGLWGIAIVNWLLNLITFTLYRFWAKTRVRRHIWSCVHINGEPLEYTGTGRELFLGALVVFGVLFMPIVVFTGLIYLTLGPESPLLAGTNVLASLVVVVLYGMAVYRARRYRLSRTLWRGIRGTLTGSPTRYTFVYLGALVLKFVTFGWSTPAMNLELEHRIANEAVFGTMPFRFSGGSGPLYRRYAVCWFATLIAAVIIVGGLALAAVASGSGLAQYFRDFGTHTGPAPKSLAVLGVAGITGLLLMVAVYSLIWAAYTARQMNTFARYTTFDKASFTLNATAWSLVGLNVGNILILHLHPRARPALHDPAQHPLLHRPPEARRHGRLGRHRPVNRDHGQTWRGTGRCLRHRHLLMPPAPSPDSFSTARRRPATTSPDLACRRHGDCRSGGRQGAPVDLVRPCRRRSAACRPAFAPPPRQ